MTTVHCLNDRCRYCSKSDICGLIEITIDATGLCENRTTIPPVQSSPTTPGKEADDASLFATE